MSQKEKKSLLSYLKVLMLHVLKWKNQPSKRTLSWTKSINNSRKEIDRIKERKPSLDDAFLKENWETTRDRATSQADSEMRQAASAKKLTWDEVFKNKYTLILFALLAISGVLMVVELTL